MLSAPQVRRVRQIIELQEQVSQRVRELLAGETKRAGPVLPGMLDMRLSRVERDISAMEAMMLETTRITQDAIMARYAAREGITLENEREGAA